MSDAISRSLAALALRPALPVSPALRHAVTDRLADSFAVSLAGLRHDTTVAVHRYVEAFESTGRALVWGTRHRTHPELAALANGVATRVLDYNDSYFSRSGLHPSDMLGGLVAVSEHVDASWLQLVEAIVVAYESSARFADSLVMGRHGWDQAVLAGIGTVVGVGRLVGSSSAELEAALAIHVVSSITTFQTRVGRITPWKAVAGPEAVRRGVSAVFLAASGIDGPDAPFLGEAGLLRLVRRHLEDPDDLTDLAPILRSADSPDPDRILRSRMKSWPCGHLAHPGIAAALRLREAGATADVIGHVLVRVPRITYAAMGGAARQFPTNSETADHSLAYVVSSALVHGEVTPGSFRPKRVAGDSAVRDLSRRLHVVEADDLTDRYPEHIIVEVAVDVRDGRRLVERVSASAAEVVLDRARLRRKLRECVPEESNIDADELWEGLARMPDEAPVTELVGRLEAVGSPATSPMSP